MPRASWSVLLTLVIAGGCSKHEPNPASDGTFVVPYLEVQEKLADDETTDLEPIATRLVAVASSAAGQGGVERVLEGARKLPTTDLAAARSAFKTLSAGVIENLRAHPEQQAGLMIVHCPMTFDGSGASWVQVTGPVRNPYEGRRMPNCGDKVSWAEEPVPAIR